jgi:hypothetical protein
MRNTESADVRDARVATSWSRSEAVKALDNVDVGLVARYAIPALCVTGISLAFGLAALQWARRHRRHGAA